LSETVCKFYTCVNATDLVGYAWTLVSFALLIDVGKIVACVAALSFGVKKAWFMKELI
jgi:hypothetical protein